MDEKEILNYLEGEVSDIPIPQQANIDDFSIVDGVKVRTGIMTMQLEENGELMDIEMIVFYFSVTNQEEDVRLLVRADGPVAAAMRSGALLIGHPNSGETP